MDDDDDGIAAELERDLRALQQETVLSDLDSDLSSIDDDDIFLHTDSDDDDADQPFLCLKQCIEASGTFVTSSIDIRTNDDDDHDLLETLSLDANPTPGAAPQSEGEASASSADRDEGGVDDELVERIRELDDRRQADLERERAKAAAMDERRQRQEEGAAESARMAFEDMIGALCLKDERRQRRKERDLMRDEDERERRLMVARASDERRASRETDLMTAEDGAARRQRDRATAERDRERARMLSEDRAATTLADERRRERRHMQREDDASRARMRREQHDRRPAPTEVLTRRTAARVVTNKALAAVAELDFAEQCERWIARLHPLPRASAGQHVRALRVPDQALRDVGAVAGLRHLEQLDVSGNPLASLNALWLSPRLMSLAASACGLTSIVGVIRCPVIQSIDLSRNRLTMLTIDAAPFLETLRLDGNAALSAPLLRWAPRLPGARCNVGGWRGVAWQRRLQRQPRSLREAIAVLSLPVTNAWRQNAAERIRDWWRRQHRRRRRRMAIRIQRRWRWSRRRRRASMVVQRWWRSVSIRRKIRLVLRRGGGAAETDDDDIERLQGDFFDFIRGDLLPDEMMAFDDDGVVHGSGAREDALQHGDGDDDARVSAMPETAAVRRRDDGEAGLAESGGNERHLRTERSASPASTTGERLQERGGEAAGWNFSSEATRRAFQKKARRMRQMKAQKARREATPMQRVQYLRRSPQSSRVKA